MVIVCSSTEIEAVISRAEGEVLMVIGWSSNACEGPQETMEESSCEMMSGETYFSVQVSRARLSWREAESRHHSFVGEGRCRRHR